MAPYNPQLGNTVTPILGLILSLYEDQEHREKFWVANNDSIAHTGVINVIAWHD